LRTWARRAAYSASVNGAIAPGLLGMGMSLISAV
jgi:hypothetical protein